jgi:tripartite-type tricarboxylate transporter receptor subunit TctC
MAAERGQGVAIENVGGESGTIGVTHAVRAVPDGYTLAAFHRAEIEKWWPIIKAANIQG